MRRRLAGLAALALLAAGSAPAAPPPVPAVAPPAPALAPVVLPGLGPDVPTTPPPYAARLRAETRRVLDGPDFHRPATSRELVARDWLRRLLQREAPPASPREPWNLSGLAGVLKVLLYAAALLAIAWLAWRGSRWLAPLATRPRPLRQGAVLEARSLLLADAPLPDSVASAAHAAWRGGHATLALSLLYRGAVRDLGQRHGIALPDSATEGECLRLARRSGKAVAEAAFAPLVQAWMALAYARREPADFEALLRLYQTHFEPPAETSP